MKMYDSKQELRKDLEHRTNPDNPLREQVDYIMSSAMAGGLIGVRNALSLLKTFTDEHDYPCEEHQEIARRTLAGMTERMTAFEMELLGVFTDLAWEVNNCDCDHCVKVAAEMEVEDKERKAKFN